jgi:hypothetical protein
MSQKVDQGSYARKFAPRITPEHRYSFRLDTFLGILSNMGKTRIPPQASQPKNMALLHPGAKHHAGLWD